MRKILWDDMLTTKKLNFIYAIYNDYDGVSFYIDNIIKDNPDSKFICVLPKKEINYFYHYNSVFDSARGIVVDDAEWGENGNTIFKELLEDSSYKLDDALYTLDSNHSFIITDELFTLYRDKIVENIKDKNYVLILGLNTTNVEENEDIGYYGFDISDIKIFLQHYVSTNKDTGRLEWKLDDTYDGKFFSEKEHVDKGHYYEYDGNLIHWVDNIYADVVTSFNKTFVLFNKSENDMKPEDDDCDWCEEY